MDGSFDEEAFVSEAGIGSADGFGDGGGAGGAAAKMAGAANASANAIEKALTAFYRATGLGRLSDFLRGNATACGVAWVGWADGAMACLLRPGKGAVEDSVEV